MARKNIHVWKTRLEDGRRREVRAELFAKKWTFEAYIEGDEDWTSYREPLLEDLIELRYILRSKYQRKHLAWEHLEGVERLIRDRESRS